MQNIMFCRDIKIHSHFFRFFHSISRCLFSVRQSCMRMKISLIPPAVSVVISVKIKFFIPYPALFSHRLFYRRYIIRNSQFNIETVFAKTLHNVFSKRTYNKFPSARRNLSRRPSGSSMHSITSYNKCSRTIADLSAHSKSAIAVLYYYVTK